LWLKKVLRGVLGKKKKKKEAVDRSAYFEEKN